MKMSAQRETDLIRKDIKVLEARLTPSPSVIVESDAVGAEEF